MAVNTLNIVWNSSSVDRTPTRLLTVIRDFLVSKGWTVVDDMIVNPVRSGHPELIVTYDRNTGFAGDNLVVFFQFYNNSLYTHVVDSWNPVTHSWGYYSSYYGVTPLSFTSDMDLLLSCDETFITLTSKISGVRGSHQLVSATCFERYSGDSDIGSFYGSWRVTESNIIGVPSSWNVTPTPGANSHTTAVFNLATTVGPGATALDGVNEASTDVIFKLYTQLPTYGKHKGSLYGVRVSTNNASLLDSTISPVLDGCQWYTVKYGTQSFMMPYNTPTVVT